MRKKIDIRCWSCGQPSMIPDDTIGQGWMSCTRCGATYMPNPTKPKHIAPLDTWVDQYGLRHYHPEGVHD